MLAQATTAFSDENDNTTVMRYFTKNSAIYLPEIAI